jgi:hypothetical protein
VFALQTAKFVIADFVTIWQHCGMLILLLYLILLLTTIWVGIDAHLNRIPTGNKPYSGGSAVLWVVMCIVLWIAAFPVYLVKRAKTLQERNPAAGAPVVASILGGLSIVIVMFCIVGTIIWGTGIQVAGDERLSDAELAKQVRQAIEGKWRANPASQTVHMKDVTLSRGSGNDYTGIVTAEISGQEKRFPLRVTYDGQHFSFEVSDEAQPSAQAQPSTQAQPAVQAQPSAEEQATSPEDRLRARVTKNIEDLLRGDPATRNARVKSVTLTRGNGNEYKGIAIADLSGQEKKYPFRATYDAHDNFSLQMGEEEKRMSDDELRDDVRQTIEKNWAENPAQKNIRMKSITLAHQSGNEYAGIVIADVSGHEEKHTLKVTYDGSTYSYSVGNPSLSLEELRAQVGEMIERKWRENPESQNVHLKSMTLEHQSGIEYAGIVIATVSGREKKLSLHVHYDGKSFTYEVE